MTTWKAGDIAMLVDHSDRHGDIGVIWHVQDNAIILLDLGDCIWPVEADEINPVPVEDVHP